MKSIMIKPSKLRGEVIAPPSKSLSHRALICSSLCRKDAESKIDNIILSEDIKATIESMERLGADIKIEKKNNETYEIKVRGIKDKIKEAELNCKESGSTLRFLIPIAMTLAGRCTFMGSGKLVERPLDVYYKIFDEQGISYTNNNGMLPLNVVGSLGNGEYIVSGNVSSQFISGLFFALPLLEGDSTIKITDKLESKGYIDLTLDIMQKYGVHIENKNYEEFKIKGRSGYQPADYCVEGDFSQAAFFLAAKELGNDIECTGVDINSLQGDKEIIDIIKKYKDNEAEEIIIDASQIPDLVPIVTVLASLSYGKKTRIINAERVRIKESDRLKAITCELNKIGADVTETEDGLVICGQKSLKGNAIVNSWNDHRIAMSLAIAATRCEEAIELEGYEAVNKSYPSFWEVYRSAGGNLVYNKDVSKDEVVL